VKLSRGMGAIRDELKRPKGYAEGGKAVAKDPSLWSSVKAAARSKFDVYPSAYANAWAAKEYKKRGGTWGGSDNRVKKRG
jgi:hypothetical protein